MTAVGIQGTPFAWPDGGSGRRLLHLLRELARRPDGMEFHVYLPRGVAPPAVEGAVVFHETPFPAEGTLARAAAEALGYAALLRRDGIALFHAENLPSPPTPPGVRRVLTLHDLRFHSHPRLFPPARRLAARVLWPREVRRADRIVAVSATAAREAERFLGADPARLRVVGNGVERRFRRAPAPEVAALRARLDLPPRFALYLGRLARHKNLDALLEAHAALGESAWPLLLSGTGAEEARLRKRAAALRSAQPVRFLGFTGDADLPALYSAAGAFVQPSTCEGFGLPPLEAAACGCPVIAPAAGPAAEVLGPAFLPCGAAGVEELRAARARLETDDALRAELAAAGPAAAARWTWADAADRLRAVWRELVA
jgi:alpha-1,3-rhamnosyl/mannosyltransferase